MTQARKIYNYVIFILSLYVLVELSLEFLIDFPAKLLQITAIIDFIICMIFLSDWVYFLLKAEKKGSYFLSRIFDLVSAIPFIPGLRFLRVFRIFRFLRGFRGIMGLARAFNKKPMESALLYYIVYLVIIFFYCTMAYNRYEVGINSDLKSFGDAVWLAFTTLTTIGYGDIHPDTSEVRIVSAILVVTGTGFFALLSGEFATILIKASRKQ